LIVSHCIQKINSKWIKDLNVRPKTIKALEDTHMGNTSAVGLGRDLDMTLKAWATKAKLDKQDYIKWKNLLHSREAAE
jgi:hypothetical protein